MDTGLTTAVLKLNAQQLRRNHNMLGHLLESFVYAELRKQASWLDTEIAFYHYRDKDQYGGGHGHGRGRWTLARH